MIERVVVGPAGILAGRTPPAGPTARSAQRVETVVRQAVGSPPRDPRSGVTAAGHVARRDDVVEPEFERDFPGGGTTLVLGVGSRGRVQSPGSAERGETYDGGPPSYPRETTARSSRPPTAAGAAYSTGPSVTAPSRSSRSVPIEDPARHPAEEAAGAEEAAAAASRTTRADRIDNPSAPWRRRPETKRGQRHRRCRSCRGVPRVAPPAASRDRS